MRTFIAIDLPGAVLDALGALSGRLRAAGVRASWTKPENVHLTLRFLGEIDEAAAGQLGDLLAERCADTKPFSLEVRGTGAFPNSRRPSVLWAGVGPVEGGLNALWEAAENASRAIGSPPENREFSPHLTLARIKDSREAGPLMELFEKERDFYAGEFTVSSVSLFSSRLTPRGPVYTRLREFRF
jgi:2'-5' RNA ligase